MNQGHTTFQTLPYILSFLHISNFWVINLWGCYYIPGADPGILERGAYRPPMQTPKVRKKWK